MFKELHRSSRSNLRKSHSLKKKKPLISFVLRVSCVQAVDESENLIMGDSFIRPHLTQLSAYQPILPFEVLSAQLGRKSEDIVKLDANENPYGPPPEVFEALGNMKFPYVYPDPQSRTLCDALAQDSGLESDKRAWIDAIAGGYHGFGVSGNYGYQNPESHRKRTDVN